MTDRSQKPKCNAIHFVLPREPEQSLLPNGIPLLVLDEPRHDVVRVDVVIGAGTRMQDKLLQCRHALELLDAGTRTHTKAQIAEMVDFHGAQFGVQVYATNGCVSFLVLGRYLDRLADLVFEMMTEPTYPADELAMDMDCCRHNIALGNRKMNVLCQRRFRQMVFGKGHPMSSHATEADCDKLTPDDLRRFARRHIHSGNCRIYVSGKVTPAVVHTMERTFGSAPWGEHAKADVANPVPWQPEDLMQDWVERPMAVQDAMVAGMPIPAEVEVHNVFTDMAVCALGGYFGSRLTRNIRERNGYTYGISAQAPRFLEGRVLQIATQADPRYVHHIIREIGNELDALQQQPMPADELQKVRSYMAGSWCRAQESAFSAVDFWIRQYMERRTVDDVKHGIYDMEHASAIDIMHTARKIFSKENLKICIAGQKFNK